MNRPPEPPETRLSTLDIVSFVMDRPDRPLDFTSLIHSHALPDVERLRAGARSATERYAVTGSRMDGRRWIRTSQPADQVEMIAASSEAAAADALEAFVGRGFDLRVQVPVRQLLVTGNAGGPVLATRFHHAAADGASAAMWLAHQVRVACGEDEPAPGPVLEPRLRTRPRQAGGQRGRSPRSARLWHRDGRPTRARRWHSIEFSVTDLHRGSPERSEFTYNDLLTTIALDVLADWNRRHGVADRNVGLWLPIDIRRTKLSGFGNGTSRIRIHAQKSADAPLRVRCRHVHEQISGSIRAGEWVVPDTHPLTRLPHRLLVPVLRAYLSRPWADFGTATFSHMDRWGGEPLEFFDRVDRIEIVGPLHRHHPVSITGVTHGDRTWLTFTFDPALLRRSDAEELGAMYLDRIALAQRELACAA